jgi:hypothetical protein
LYIHIKITFHSLVIQHHIYIFMSFNIHHMSFITYYSSIILKKKSSLISKKTTTNQIQQKKQVSQKLMVIGVMAATFGAEYIVDKVSNLFVM